MGMVQLNLFDGKYCTNCKEWRLLNQFYKDPTRSDGIASQCAFCRRAYQQLPTSKERYKKRDQERASKRAELKPPRPRLAPEERAEHGRRYRAKYYREKAKPRYVHRGRTKLSPEERKQRNTARQHNRYLANKERSLAKSREWQQKNPERNAARALRYWARKQGSEGTFTFDEWRALCEKYDNRCLCCGKQVRLTPDHVRPLSKGGTNTIENLQPLCKSCNCSKRDKEIDYRPR